MCLTDGQADSYRCNLSVYSLHIFLLHIFLPMVLFVCVHVCPGFCSFPVCEARLPDSLFSGISCL